MKVFVTGGTGFLGRHVVWRLLKEGHDVAFSGRNERQARVVLDEGKGNTRYIQMSHGEAGSGAILQKGTVSFDAIIHTAGLSSPWGRKMEFEKSNVSSMKEVISACHKNEIGRVVHISTPSLYFDYADRFNIHENDRLPVPVNDYAATKRHAEEDILASNIPQVVILRPRALYGSWDNTLFPRFLNVINRGSIPLPFDGRAMLDLTYIDNAVDAIMLALQKDIPSSKAIYNVSNGDPISFKDLLKKISHEFSLPVRTQKISYRSLDLLARGMEIAAKLHPYNKEPLLTRYSAGTLAFSQTLDISAIKKDLGYRPSIRTGEGIERYAQWWRQHRDA